MSTWTEMLNTEGPKETKQRIIEVIEADTFLLRAVEVTDVDWCIQRLTEVKKQKGNARKLIDIALR